MPIRVAIVDDHEVTRAGLRAILSASTEFAVAAEANSGERAVELASSLPLDVMILDVHMPGTDGLSALGRLRTQAPNLPVVMLTGHDNPTFAARAMALGAAAYMLKSSSCSEIVNAVRRTAAGERLWGREEVRRMTGAMSTPRAPADLGVPLTRRETEVLTHLAMGLSNKEIALAMEISYETVKEHVQHILRKLGVADRTQAAVWAVRKGLA